MYSVIRCFCTNSGIFLGPVSFVAVGFSDFTEGIFPDFLIEDDLLNAKPFGSFEDPMLAKALEEISGVTPAIKKTTASGSGDSGGFVPLRTKVKPVPERIIKWPEK